MLLDVTNGFHVIFFFCFSVDQM